MIFSDEQFAVLISTGIISEIARMEDTNGIPTYNRKIEEFIFGLSKIVLSQTNDTWLLKLREGSKMTEVLVMELVGCDLKEIATIMSDSIEALMIESEILPDWDDHNKEVEICITTTQMQRETRNKPSSKGLAVKKADKVKAGRNPASSIEMIPDLNVKPPSPNIILVPITTWIGKQLLNQEISKSLKSQIITSYEKYLMDSQ
jgi:hypothetical protein